MTNKPITERLLKRPYRVQQSGADSWRWAVMLGADVVLKRTQQSQAQAEADRLNAEWRKERVLALMAERMKPLVEALEQVAGECEPARKYAESYGLEGGKMPSAVHIKINLIEGYARATLAQWEADNG